jgi:hypothetical protein
MPTILDLLDFIRRKGSVEQLPKCDAVAGAPCPNLPVLNGLVLYFRGAVVLSYARWCRQTKLLEAFQSQGWPEFIEDRSPYGAENGLRDIVPELNDRQQSGQRLPFWHEGRRLFWKINDDEPARPLAAAGPGSQRSDFGSSGQA